MGTEADEQAWSTRAENGELRAVGEVGLMRFLAFCARHPWLRAGLVLLAAAAVLAGGVRLWTSVPPDAVHLTVTYVDTHEWTGPPTKTVVDRTIHDGAVAQRLQRDLAALPLVDPFATTSCAIGPPTYNTYTLTWYRFGLPVEHASASHTCGETWVEDGVFFHVPVNADALYADIAAAIALPDPGWSPADDGARIETHVLPVMKI